MKAQLLFLVLFVAREMKMGSSKKSVDAEFDGARATRFVGVVPGDVANGVSWDLPILLEGEEEEEEKRLETDTVQNVSVTKSLYQKLASMRDTLEMTISFEESEDQSSDIPAGGSAGVSTKAQRELKSGIDGVSERQQVPVDSTDAVAYKAVRNRVTKFLRVAQPISCEKEEKLAMENPKAEMTNWKYSKYGLMHPKQAPTTTMRSTTTTTNGLQRLSSSLPDLESIGTDGSSSSWSSSCQGDKNDPLKLPDNAKRCPTETKRKDTETTVESARRNTSRPIILQEQVVDKCYCCRDWWTRMVMRTHMPILMALRAIAIWSAMRPKRTIAIVILSTIALLGTGLATNFNVNVDDQQLWTPADSLPNQHSQWIFDTSRSGFRGGKRWIVMLFHDNGNNVLTMNRVRKVFSVLDTLRESTNMTMACKDGLPFLTLSSSGCSIYGPTSFWSNSRPVFDEQVTSDQDMLAAMSVATLPEGVPAIDSQIFGKLERDSLTSQAISAQSMVVAMHFWHTDDSLIWEDQASDIILRLRDEWAADYAFEAEGLLIEMQAKSSMAGEFKRAIANDIPLVPIVFVVMATFTAMAFARTNNIHSRSALGIGAVVAVLLSICSGFGILFIIGVPFTSITQILPFIIFGIGLDDSFVIFSSYCRTDPKRDPVERICDTIDDVGLSIMLTTLTSTTAFALGCISSVPAVRWLCFYAFPTIMIVFLYQMTFFVACIVIDEHRVQAKRRDPILCCGACTTQSKAIQRNVVDETMAWYGTQLVRPQVRLLVVAGFAVLLGFGIHSALSLTQSFEITDVLPKDSFVTDFLSKGTEYRGVGPLTVAVYFRDCDHSDPEVRLKMQKYVDDLLETDYFDEMPDYFWVKHFNFFATNPVIATRPFQEQMKRFLEHPIYGELFGNDITRDEAGNVIASRTFIRMHVDLSNVHDQVMALHAQRVVSEMQGINRGKDRFAFFTYEGSYKMSEFFTIAVNELIFTTISGVVAVTLTTMIFIPHWSASLFVLPLISILYVDLLGVMQWAGLHVNAVSYVSMAMSIGILVDFLMHALFRYYECSGSRVERTIEMIRTMGSSILLGAISTFLGIIPLMFCSSDIFKTVFYCFLGIVTLGAGHGLILLPALLATFGPESPRTKHRIYSPLKKFRSRSGHTLLANRVAMDQAVATVMEASESSATIIYLDPATGLIYL